MLKTDINLNKNHKEKVFDELFEDSSPNLSFFLLLIFSAVIVSCGLLMDNSSIVIGGMLIAPILWPILSLAMGVVVSDYRLIKNSLLVVLKAVALVFVISAVIGIFFLERGETAEIISRTDYLIAYLFVALFSGLAASYAFSHPRLSGVLPGVAISVALIPPLCVMGIAVSMVEWSFFVRAGGVFFLNFLGIIFGAIIVFSMLNFNEITRRVKKVTEEEEKKKEEEEKEQEKENLKKIEKTLKEAKAVLEDKKENHKKKENKNT